MTVELWGTNNCGTEKWCAKLGGTDKEFCAATACTDELSAILGSPVEWCSILLGGTVLEVKVGDVRLVVLFEKEFIVA